jgi:hypothetical protein
MLLTSAGFSPVSADTAITPTSNIVGSVIPTREFKVELEFQHDIHTDDDSIINLYERDVLVDITYEINGSVLEISKTTDYAPKRDYRLDVRNIKTDSPGVTFNDFSYLYRYSSYQRFRIGKTVEGRAIWAYSVGEGNKDFLMIGAMHGDERNTASLVTSMIDEFRARPGLIPDDTKLIFVPTLNRDGYYDNNRFNARGVDLNRNSKTKDWEKTTYIGSQRIPNGGGAYPNSEAETRIIQKLVLEYDPFFTVSYHSAAGMVLTNGRYVRNITRSYANETEYRYVDQSSGDEGFGYRITGDFTVWLYEKGYRAMTVELPTRNSADFGNNFDALVYIVNSY